MKFAVHPYGKTSHVPALTTVVAGVGEFGSMPGQTSVVPGPAARGFALPLEPALFTCFLNVVVNHAGFEVLRVLAADAVVALTLSTRTATTASRTPLSPARMLISSLYEFLPCPPGIPVKRAWDTLL